MMKVMSHLIAWVVDVTEYHRLFRVVPSMDFLSTFASDRRHMRRADGTWMKIPPEYPPISTKESTHNLV